MNSNKYTCAICKVEYVKDWTDEEAEKELEENFKGSLVSDCDVVCEGCYNKIMSKGLMLS